MSCKEAMSAMLGVVERGGAIPDEQREHLRTCARCRELLDSMNTLHSEMHQPPAHTPSVDDRRLTREVRNARVRDFIRRALTAGITSMIFVTTIGFFALRKNGFSTREVTMVIGVGTVLAVALLVMFYLMLAVLRDRNGNRICKRLRPGRQLSGVCLGLSEATGIAVVVFRLAFVALLFVKGIGLFLYILLDLAMPVHPDDRQYLLRFKLRRMWQRRFAHADHDPRRSSPRA